MTQVEQLKASVLRRVAPDLRGACQQIDLVLGENKRGFHWVQVKEKFGSARFCYRLGGAKRLVVDLIDGQGATLSSSGQRRKGTQMRIASTPSSTKRRH